MPITVNEGGTLYELDEVWSNEGGTLYEQDTVHSNEGGTLCEIHSSTLYDFRAINIDNLVDGSEYYCEYNRGINITIHYCGASNIASSTKDNLRTYITFRDNVIKSGDLVEMSFKWRRTGGDYYCTANVVSGGANVNAKDILAASEWKNYAADFTATGETYVNVNMGYSGQMTLDFVITKLRVNGKTIFEEV